MREKQEVLKKAIENLDIVCEKIKTKENYMQEMPKCVEAVNGAVMMLLAEENSNQKYILQLLEDMMYGMTQQDEVFLLDVLCFGLKTGLEACYHQFEN